MKKDIEKRVKSRTEELEKVTKQLQSLSSQVQKLQNYQYQLQVEVAVYGDLLNPSEDKKEE